jgi:hypothetical protein
VKLDCLHFVPILVQADLSDPVYVSVIGAANSHAEGKVAVAPKANDLPIESNAELVNAS